MSVDPEPFDLHMSDCDTLMWNIEKDPLLRSTIVDRARARPRARLGPAGRAHRARHAAHPAAAPARRRPPSAGRTAALVGRPRLRPLATTCAGCARPSRDRFDAVLDLARTAAMADFDRARPLWEYTLVEGLDRTAARRVVLKVHHSMTDGVGGMKLLLMLFDFEREPDARGPPRPEPAPLPHLHAARHSCRSAIERTAAGAPSASLQRSVGRRRAPRECGRARRPASRTIEQRRARRAARSPGSWRPRTDPALADHARRAASTARPRHVRRCRSTTSKRAAKAVGRHAERRVRRRSARRAAPLPRGPRRRRSTTCA